MKKSRGFTLIELLVAITIFSIISIAIMNIFNFQIKSFFMNSTKAQTQIYTRGLSDTISRMIGYSKEVYLINDIPSTFDDNYAYIYSRDGAVKFRNPLTKKELDLNPDISNGTSTEFSNFVNSQSLDLTFTMENIEVPNYIKFDIKAKKSKLGNSEYDVTSQVRAENSFKSGNINYASAKMVDTTVGTKAVKQATGKVIKFILTEQYDLKNTPTLILNDTWYAMMQKAINDGNAKVDPVTGEIKIDGYSSDAGITTDNMYISAVTDDAVKKVKPTGALGDVDKYNYSINTKVSVSGDNTGYRILINGATRKEGTAVFEQKQISGFAFEYEPNLGGFRIIRLQKGKVDNSGPFSGRSFGANFAGKSEQLYTFDMIKTDKFDFQTDKTSSYNVNLKVITKPGTSNLLIKAVLTDKNNNSSMPMYFGDFGAIKMADNTIVKGADTLIPIDAGGDFSNKTTSPQIGTQAVYFKKGKVPPESKVAFESGVFGMAPPDVTKAEEGRSTTADGKNTQTIDLGFSRAIKPAAEIDKAKFTVSDKNGNPIPLNSVKVTSDGKVQLVTQPNIVKGPTGATTQVDYDLSNVAVEYDPGAGANNLIDLSNYPIDSFKYTAITK
nr:prepilin-type N-terminal cleavage/methylation domain-containing protein [uncultured Criibacterium sp.]